MAFPRPAPHRREQRKQSASLCTSLIARTPAALIPARSATRWAAPRLRIVDYSHGAIGVGEDFIRNPADVRFADFVEAVYGAEQLAPIVITRLISGQLGGEPFIVG